MRDYVILLLFLMLPFAFIAPGLLHGGHHLFFVLSALIVVGLLCDNKWASLFLIYIALWQLWLFIDILYISHTGIKQVSEGFMQIIFALSGAILFVAIKKSKIKPEWFYNVICVTAMVQALIAITQMFDCDPVIALLKIVAPVQAIFSSTTIVGTLSNPNFLAAYLVFSFPFFLRIRKPYFYKVPIPKTERVLYIPKPSWCWFIPVVLFLLIESKTSTAVVALIAGMIVYFAHLRLWNTRVWLLFVLGGCGYVLYDGNIFFPIIEGKIQFHPRFQFWVKAIENMNSISNVIFGLGPAAPRVWGVSSPMHNDWLTIFYQYGLVGLSLVVGYVVTIYRSNKMLFSAVIIVLVNMTGSYPLHLAPSAFLIIIIVGLIEREKELANA